MFLLFVDAGNLEDGPRVVFMVDLWHPNVAAAERQALDYIFTPGRLDDKEGKWVKQVAIREVCKSGRNFT